MKASKALQRQTRHKPDLESVFSRAPETRHRRIGDEAVIIHQANAQVLGLNEVGAEIFDLFDGRRRLGEIITELESSFDVERTQLQQDVLSFVSSLLDADMVVVCRGEHR